MVLVDIPTTLSTVSFPVLKKEDGPIPLYAKHKVCFLCSLSIGSKTRKKTVVHHKIINVQECAT